MNSNVADAFVAQLAAGGVERIYGVIGDAVFPLAAALDRQRAIRFVATTHETHAAYMASYEAKLTGRPVACMATAGPGTTNLATGLADAYFDGAPVIAITGQVQSTKIGTGEKQYFDQQTFFHSITASTDTAMSGEAALHALLSAMERATRCSTVTHLSVPKDVFLQAVEWSPVAIMPKSESSHHRIVGDGEKAIKRLKNSQCPIMIVGDSRPEVVQASMDLADTIGAAVVVAQQVKGAVPYDYDRLIGGVGEAHVPSMINDADMMILVGDAPYEIDFIPPHVPSVVVSPMHRTIMKHPLIAEWVGDVLENLRYLRSRLADHLTDEKWQDAIHATRRALNHQVEDMLFTHENGIVNPYTLAVKLSEYVADNAVIAVDTGAFSHWFDLGFRVKHQTILASSRWRPIGMALPAAIAAKIADPGRQVVAIVGDGAFLPSMGELATAVRYELPIVIIIVNNAIYDIERQKMLTEGFGSLGTALPSVNYVAYAEACGAAGFRAHSSEMLDVAIKQGLDKATNHPVVIDVRTSVPILPHLVGMM